MGTAMGNGKVEREDGASLKLAATTNVGQTPHSPRGGAEHILNNFIMIPYLFQLAIKTGLPHKIFTCN